MAERVSFFRKSPGRFSLFAVVLAVFVALATSPAGAQIRGIPPSVTSIPNHVPPYGVPNIPASVTSLGPYGYCCQRPSNIPYRNPAFPNRYNRRGNYGYGYGYGYGYAVPYYYAYPSDDSSYYGSGGSGQYLYSGPPQGQTPPAEQTLHIIVDPPPQKTASHDQLSEHTQHVPDPVIPDAKPGVPTILVFRDGHKQSVTNYAIMGQTVYVFDDRTKKIALADLDVPATEKANDDQGVEFQVPKAKQSKPAKSGVPLQSVPDQQPKSSTSSTTATP
jgi:hypothetical protein